jgi:hypothetical protein
MSLLAVGAVAMSGCENPKKEILKFIIIIHLRKRALQ